MNGAIIGLTTVRRKYQIMHCFSTNNTLRIPRLLMVTFFGNNRNFVIVTVSVAPNTGFWKFLPDKPGKTGRNRVKLKSQTFDQSPKVNDDQPISCTTKGVGLKNLLFQHTNTCNKAYSELGRSSIFRTRL